MSNEKTFEPVKEPLSKREYFSGLAMQAIVANNKNNWTSEDIAFTAVHHADWLLKQLSKPTP